MNTARTSKGRIRMMGLALTCAVAGTSLATPALAAVRVIAPPSGRTLRIVGDREPNEVAVRFIAESDAIEVTAGAALLGRFAAAPVQSISVRLSGGDDSLIVQLASEGRLGLLKVRASLGTGSDFAGIDVDPGVKLFVSGGAGEDTVRTSGPTDSFRSVEQVVTATALIGGSGGLGYTCSGTTPEGKTECECDKSKPLDCLVMYINECAAGQFDDFSRCVKGSITTHCSCTKAIVQSDPGLFLQPVDGGLLLTR